VLHDRIAAEGYVEHEGDITAASGLAEDLRDILLEYWVSIIQKSRYDRRVAETGCLNRWHSNRQCTIRIVD